MPRATGLGSRLASYEGAWEAINRLIRSGGSWSGYERNCFYANAGDRFVNTSAVSGLDAIEDGRGLAVWDYDRDGDPDLLVKNRNGPQLRIWRNESRSPHARITLRLAGRSSNRQAIGARVSLKVGSSSRVKELRAGSGFLSQNAAVLFFGLGDASKIDRLEVRWPSGRKQSFDEVPVNRAYSLREGDAALKSRAFERPVEIPADLPPASAGDASEEPSGLWLLDPIPLPETELHDARGRRLGWKDFRGRPVLVNLWSPDCRTCLHEFEEWAKVRRGQAALSGQDEVALVALIAPGDDGGERARALASRFDVPAFFTTPRDLLAISILVEDVTRWPRELPLPTSLLLDGDGRLVKLYRGPVAWDRVVADARSIPRNKTSRLRAGLPFRGRYFASGWFRSPFQLGVAYLDAGFSQHASASFEEALRRRPGEVEARYNLGLIHLDANRLDEAGRCFSQALQRRPEFVDASVNLGVVLARLGEFEVAEIFFHKAIESRPTHVEALMNLGNLNLARGRPREAVRWFGTVVDVEPRNAEARKALGGACRRLGDGDGARKAFEAATRLAPLDADAWNKLAVILAESGETEEALEAGTRAVEVAPGQASSHNNLGLIQQGLGRQRDALASFRRAIELDPAMEAPYLNAAKLHVLRKENGDAREILETLLKVAPAQAEALRLLELTEECWK